MIKFNLVDFRKHIDKMTSRRRLTHALRLIRGWIIKSGHLDDLVTARELLRVKLKKQRIM